MPMLMSCYCYNKPEMASTFYGFDFTKGLPFTLCGRQIPACIGVRALGVWFCISAPQVERECPRCQHAHAPIRYPGRVQSS